MPEISFWRDLERRFLRLQEDGNRMAAIWSSVPCTAAGDHWYLDGGGTGFGRKRFQTLAESAAVELGHSEEASGLLFWLDLLKKESPFYCGGGISNSLDEDGKETTSEFGHVPLVCAASAEFCTKCETKAVIRNRGLAGASGTAAAARAESESPLIRADSAQTASSGQSPEGLSGGRYDATQLLQLAEEFRKTGDALSLSAGKLRADFFTEPQREAWGIWKLKPNTKETEAAREKFRLKATLAVQAFDIVPIRAPRAHEFDPNWSEEARPFIGSDGLEPIPSGLDEVDPCTRAWLHFLRLEAEKNKSRAFTVWNGGLSISDVWEASAVQCERCASELIGARLTAKVVLRDQLSCGTKPALSSPVDHPLNLGSGGTNASERRVAVCPAIIPGHRQAPNLFSSEEEASRWLSQHDPKNTSGAAREKRAEPVAQEAIPGTGSPSTDPPPPGDLVDVNSHNERWRPPVRISHVADYDFTVPFEGSVASFLPLTPAQMPDGPTLGAKIDWYFKRLSPEIVCSLADDWEFEKLLIDPKTRLGHYNLVEQAGMVGTVFHLVLGLEANLKSRFPKLPAAAAADFWRSWQTSKYLTDCCWELGQSETAILLMKHAEPAENAAKRIHGFLTTQIAAFAQSVTDLGINEMPSVATDSESVPVEREGEDATSDSQVGDKVSMDQIEMALFEQLSPAGKARFRKPQTDDVYLVANADFASTCDDSFLERFPIDKVRSLAGIHAGFVHLSKRLASLAEAYFQDFVNGVDAVAKKEVVPKFGAALTEAWAAAVVQESTRKLWSDVDNVWTEWIKQARHNTGWQAFGARPRPIDDHELLILKSHDRLMEEALWQIADRHSIPDCVVSETRKGIEARDYSAARSVQNQDPPSEKSESQPSQELDHGKIARETRALTVAKLIGELNILKPQMLEDDSEYVRLRACYPDFLTFRIATNRPDLKQKVLSIRSSVKHIRLATELAAAHYGKQFGTLQDDWKDHKPVEFRQVKGKPLVPPLSPYQKP